MDLGLTGRADCHASETVPTFARVAIDGLEPANLCAHCLHKHAVELIRRGWEIERLPVAKDRGAVVGTH